MYIKTSVNVIHNNLNNEIIQSKAKIEAWKKVIIKKRKDGSEYKELTKSCLENATADKVPLYPTNNAEGYVINPRIKISTWSESGYVSDQIFISSDYDSNYDENRKIIITYHTPFVFNTADEIREKINNRIESLNDYIKELNEAINKLPGVYSAYVRDCENVIKNLENNASGNKTLISSFNRIVEL